MMKAKGFILVFIVLVGSVFVPKIRNQLVAVTGAFTGHSSTGKYGAAEGSDIEKKRFLGQFNPASTWGFVTAKTPYANRDGLYLLGDVYDAFVEMHEAARADGISLVIISATRNFEDQKRIWQGKWTGQRLVDNRNLARTVSDPVERARVILKYSAMPGTSRHHWGTDIDINSVNIADFESGTGLETYVWLVDHAADFGFIQAYTAKGEDRPHGYEEEPWHWSYNPIARVYTRQYIEKVTYDDITGFKGSDTASKVEVIEHYVLGINRDGVD